MRICGCGGGGKMSGEHRLDEEIYLATPLVGISHMSKAGVKMIYADMRSFV